MSASDFLKQVVWKNDKLTKQLLKFDQVGELDEENEDDFGTVIDDDLTQSSTVTQFSSSASLITSTVPTSTSSSSSSLGSALSFTGAVTSTQIEVPPQTRKVLDPCKLCQINEKNLMLQPCGHLICSDCWGSWKIEHHNYKMQFRKCKKRTRSQRTSEDDDNAPCPFSTCDAWVTTTLTCLH